MSESSSLGAGKPVRIFRVPAGTFAEVLTLSPHYGGCFVHWVKGERGKKGHSAYCRPEDCPPDRHRRERAWKGYAPCLLSRPADKLLEPIVLEITSSCELDFRGRWARGQWWKLEHKPESKTKNEPIAATLIGALAPANVPPAFDFRNVLLHVFHEETISLGIANPMPPRVVVAATPYRADLFKVLKPEEALKEEARR